MQRLQSGNNISGMRRPRAAGAAFLTVFLLICCSAYSRAEQLNDLSRAGVVTAGTADEAEIGTAGDYFKKGGYGEARKILGDVLRSDPSNKQARSLLTEVDKAEQDSKRNRDEARRKAAIETQKTKESAMRIASYVIESRKLMAKGNYSDARRYAFKARGENPENRQVLNLISEIDREEMFNDRVKSEAERQRGIDKNMAKSRIDVIKENKGSRSWIEWLRDSFRRKRHELGDIQGERAYTVDECVEVALARSPRLTAQEQQIKLSEIKQWEAYRDFFPTVTGKYELSSGRIGADNMVRHYRGKKYKVEVKQNLFDGMGKWYAMRQAKTNLDVAKLEKKKIVNEIVEETKKAYYGLDKSIKALDIQKKSNEQINTYFKITDGILKDGLVSRSEHLKVRAQKLQSDFQIMSSSEDLTLAELLLFQAMNMEPDQRIEIESVRPPQTTLSIGLQNCYDLAFANNPDLRIKAEVIEYYNFERKMKKARGWPKIDFDGSFGAAYENYQPLNIATDYDNPADNSGPVRAGRDMEPEWYAGVKGSIPLWGNTFEYNYVKENWAPTVSSFRGAGSATSYFSVKFLDDLAYFTDLQEARAGFDRARVDYEKARQDLMVEVKDKYFQYRKSLIQMDVVEAQAEQQKMYASVVVEQNRFGEVEASRVIDELVKSSEYEFSVVQTNADYYTSLAGLNKAIGVPDYFRSEYEDTGFLQWKTRNAPKDSGHGSD